MPPPPRPTLAPTRKASLNRRLSKARQDATGSSGGSGSDDDDDSSDGGSASEEEDVDEKLMFEKFKDQCWIELTAANLSDDIASLTKGIVLD
jgi:hypothetical protein